MGEATHFDFGLELAEQGVCFSLQVKKLRLVVGLVQFFEAIEVGIELGNASPSGGRGGLGVRKGIC